MFPEKPRPQRGLGSTARLLGGTVAVFLILGVVLTVFFLYNRQQKSPPDTDGAG